ncbi:MAG: potassium-transporting ATPase subunit KdpA, partial [Vicinamibacterales bacterium]
MALTAASALPLGWYIARVVTGRRTWLDPVLGPIERAVLRVTGTDSREQSWQAYAGSLVVSSLVMWVTGYLLLRMQGLLPLNPDGIAGMEPTLAFNTISSFVTNTNLQHYSGETGLSYLSQLAVIAFLQFTTAATGIAAAVAITRALGGNRQATIGNFYVDCTRAAVRVLLPLAVVVAIVLVSQGVPMTLEGAVRAATPDGTTQAIARGVVAAEVAIKQIGTNGGGYFGPNSSHPFENPTPLTNVVETWAILVIPMAMVVALGAILRRPRLAGMLFAVMLALYVPLAGTAVSQETSGSPAMAALGVTGGGPMEGKEVRHGVALSALWAVSTTATSNGSVNAMHDSLSPLASLAPLTGMWINAIFGGVGVGLINMLVYVVVTVFIAGMMIGRTPELLGKAVDSHEVKLASLVLLLHPLLVLGGTALAARTWTSTPDPGTALGWLHNPGSHGFTEMLYEFSSASANNGSGFEGLGDDTPFWNIATGLVMLLGRYVP